MRRDEPLQYWNDEKEPQNLSAETAVLGALLLSADALAAVKATLRPADFADSRHRVIFQAIKALESRGEPVDLLTVSTALRNAGTLENAGGLAFLTTLTEESPTTANVRFYADMVKEQANRRTVRDYGKALTELAANTRTPPEEFMEEARRLVSEITSMGKETGQRVPLTPDSWESIAALLRDKPPVFQSRFKMMTTGPEEDQALTFPTGALSIVVAPSGHGKTTFLMNLLADAAKDQPDKRHWLFSFEEQAAVVYLKTFNAWAGENFSHRNMRSLETFFKTNSTDMIERGKREEFTGKLAEFGRLVESGSVNIKQGDFYAEDLVKGIRALATDRPGLVLVDYAQLLYLDKNVRGVERREELKQICLALKDAAVDTGLCIILAAQFSREASHASFMHMSKIADAADIERAASKILGLWNGNKGAFVPPSDKKRANDFDQAAGIRAEEEGSLDGTVFLKVLKDRTGASEAWATYGFSGNRLTIDRTPERFGRSGPFPDKAKKSPEAGEQKANQSQPTLGKNITKGSLL